MSLKTPLLALFLCVLAFTSFGFEFERRRDQFDSNSGYLIVPAPYSYPGIGEGIVLIGYAGNVLETPIDAYALLITGDATGLITNVDEVFLYPETVYFRYFMIDIRKYGRNFYQNRGMDTEKEDFSVAVGDQYLGREPSLNLTLWERRLELTYGLRLQEGRITELRTPEGELLSSSTQSFKSDATRALLTLDLTDDRQDPRSGLRLTLDQEQVTAGDAISSDYTVLTTNLAAYVPVLGQSTWAFNYFRSAASVTHTGVTDLDTLKTLRGIDTCAGSSSAEQAACEEAITREAQNQQLANLNGTARSLGGPNRLRSYPEERYQGAHALSYGTEFRWNLTTSKDLLDWYFLSDIQEAVQVALFYEQGSVAESAADLGSIWRKSFGVGGRLVTGSGNVYRFDVASGDEGTEVTVLFQYPWQN